ncbi:alpha/beta hydrolase-fold protein [Puniceicoccaceae bacterium K14]|nr:alpha/beta hydrolase-fold protein [Puniceicoccaceae bacterium K14]
MNTLHKLLVVCLLLTSNLVRAAEEVGQNFDQWLEDLQTAAEEDKERLVEEYVVKLPAVPIVEGENVIFITKGASEAVPYLEADLNGYLGNKFKGDIKEWEMTRIESTTWFYLKCVLKPDALLNYRFSIGEKQVLDSLNPLMRKVFGKIYSFVAMPDYEVSQEILTDHSVKKGELLDVTITSATLKQRRNIQVYLPAGYEKESGLRYPVAVFHDGSYFINDGMATVVLDNLISRGKMQPIIAVFENPVNRISDYLKSQKYRKFVSLELMPFLKLSYNADGAAENRAIIGASGACLSALRLSHESANFGKCGLFSPSTSPSTVDRLVAELETLAHKPAEVFLSGSLYDYFSYQDSLDLKAYLEQSVDKVRYLEISEGHNFPAWRSGLDEMLIQFFPAEG